MKDRRSLWVILLASVGVPGKVAAQRLIWLGVGQGERSEAWGVSADGSVVVGEVQDNTNIPYAFRWTLTDGVTSLGTGGSQARDIDASGLAVVGTLGLRGTHHAFRKIGNGPVEDLGPAPDRTSEGWATSHSGRVVVGWHLAENGPHMRPFRWTAERGMVDLGTFGGTDGGAYDVSTDGTVVVGWAQDSSGLHRAFRWKEGEACATSDMLLEAFRGDGLPVSLLRGM